MKKLLLSFLLFALFVPALLSQTPASRSVASDMIPSDGVLRFYRLAIPVTLSSYQEDLDSDYNQVLAFWQDCEDFMNQVFVPLGCCFDVVTDQRLVMTAPNSIDTDIFSATSNGTELLNAAIGSEAYDVGMWVTHRDIFDENTGLSVLDGVYSHSTKGSGYAKTDRWVVAHEVAHLFGAVHTTTGEGSLMDTGGGDFFAYPTIRTVRTKLKSKSSAYYSDVERTTLVGSNSGGNYVYGVPVSNSAPKFDAGMKDVYRIPQGACLSIALKVTDDENHRLTSSAIGCGRADVDQLIEGGSLPPFASLPTTENLVIEYSPAYAADPFYDTDFYPVDGTNIPDLSSGNYSLSLLVNDMPAEGQCTYDALMKSPFYSQYAVWEAIVQIVAGTPFSVNLVPAKTEYIAGEQITVEWGVNANYFTADSRLRITMSDDYGRTFKYVLAESVAALDGQCTVVLPNVNVGMVDVDFITAERSMRGGIIRVEEVDGAAFTLTSLSPTDNTAFTVSGATPGGDISAIDGVDVAEDGASHYYDLRGVRVENPGRGIYIRHMPGTRSKLIVIP